MDEPLYNVYAWQFGKPETRIAEAVSWDEAQRIADEVWSRGPSWDVYIVEVDDDAGPMID